jgi:hypothetical protein
MGYKVSGMTISGSPKPQFRGDFDASLVVASPLEGVTTGAQDPACGRDELESFGGVDSADFMTFGALSPLLVGQSEAELNAVADRLEEFCAGRGKG